MNYTLKVLDALGICYGATHCEIKVPSDGPVLIECGGRIMGGSLIPTVLSSCLGHNQVELTVLAYTDPDAFYRYIEKPYSLMKYFTVLYLICPKDGFLEAVENFGLIQQLASFSNIRLYVNVGEKIHKTIDLLTAAGDVFLAHEKREIVEQDCRTIRDLEAKELILSISSEKPSVVS
jgi:hypothetical protein